MENIFLETKLKKKLIKNILHWQTFLMVSKFKKFWKIIFK